MTRLADAAALVALYDERIALTRTMANHPAQFIEGVTP